MNFDIIQKILQRRGGYPNEIMGSLLPFFNMSKHEFLNSMIDKFGKEGAEQFIQQNLRNLSKKDKIRVSPGPYVAPGYEKVSFIELDLDDVKVSIEEDDNQFWSTIELENWMVSDSNIVVETVDGEIETWDIHGFLSDLQDEYPYDFRDAVDEIERGIRKGLEKFLGVRVYLDFLLERRE